MNKTYFTSLVIVLSLLINASFAHAGNTAIEPVPRDAKWMKRHESFLEDKKAGEVKLLFIGDSITDGWRGGGKKVWDKFYAPRQALNLGIGGDRTQHVLWRLQNGEVDDLNPRVTILLIGVNNLPSRDGDPRNTVPEIVEGIGRVVKEIHTRLPKTKILLLGVFPYRQKDDPKRQMVKQINVGIAKFAKGKTIRFLDIGEKFLEPDGTLSKDIMPDLLHPNEKGYQIWADAMEPTLQKMFK